MFFNFDVGDYLIHPKYGIGKFVSLDYININNSGFDFLKLEYQEESYIYIPTYNTGILKFFKEKNHLVKIDCLNKKKTDKKRIKLQEEVQKIAQNLIENALKRARFCTFSCKKTSIFDVFCSTFEHQLTKSQEKALNEIIYDLGKTVPMDRLLCADVGFGKTEVAARSIALVLGNQKKALFVVPTTILAMQHYHTLKDRFEKIGKKCVVLSKLSKQNDLHKKMWLDGKIDLLIATAHHNGIENLLINNLALVVLDEEHHFGAKFKEKIREITHFLQLSATPIPRTLHLALSSIKDISLLSEPPYLKKKVISYVTNLETFDLNEVIKLEMEKKGKVFLVVPKVEQIKDIEKLLNVNYVILHGQMEKEAITKSLNDFLNNKVNVLLSTNIIESGINVVDANLMIIFNSHMFGMAQLHQLRGRVGRNEKQAIVYFIVPNSLKDIALDRINLICQNSNLSDGYNLSMIDMQQRGTGTVVGYQQSGNDYGFGLEMYYEMLTHALGKKQLKKDFFNIAWINFGSAFIPKEYILDTKLRIAFYKKLSQVSSYATLKEIIQDLEGFGNFPNEVKNFMQLIQINLLAKYCFITKVIRKNEKFDIYFNTIDDDFFKKVSQFFKIKDNIILDFDLVQMEKIC